MPITPVSGTQATTQNPPLRPVSTVAPQAEAQLRAAADAYIASQGTALGRNGRIHIGRDGADIWVGGDVVTCVAGTVTF